LRRLHKSSIRKMLDLEFVALLDVNGRFAERYDATPGAVSLIRPDQPLVLSCKTRLGRKQEMATLVTENRLANPDDFYEALIDTHRDLSAEQSNMVNAKLVLLLANHIGDMEVLREALSIARKGV